MSIVRRMRMLTIAALTLAVATGAVAAQTTILVKDLPPAVQTAVPGPRV